MSTMTPQQILNEVSEKSLIKAEHIDGLAQKWVDYRPKKCVIAINTVNINSTSLDNVTQTVFRNDFDSDVKIIYSVDANLFYLTGSKFNSARCVLSIHDNGFTNAGSYRQSNGYVAKYGMEELVSVSYEGIATGSHAWAIGLGDGLNTSYGEQYGNGDGYDDDGNPLFLIGNIDMTLFDSATFNRDTTYWDTSVPIVLYSSSLALREEHRMVAADYDAPMIFTYEEY